MTDSLYDSLHNRKQTKSSVLDTTQKKGGGGLNKALCVQGSDPPLNILLRFEGQTMRANQRA